MSLLKPYTEKLYALRTHTYDQCKYTYTCGDVRLNRCFLSVQLHGKNQKPLVVDFCLKFLRFRGLFSAKLGLEPQYDLFLPQNFTAPSPLEWLFYFPFFSGFMISNLGCSLAHEWQVEDGCYFSLFPITPPTVLPQAWGLLCFARGSVLCAHLPPHLLSSPQASLFSLKWPTADGGPCSDISTNNEMTGVCFFVCMQLRTCYDGSVNSLFVQGSLLYLDVLILVFGTWLLFPVHPCTCLLVLLLLDSWTSCQRQFDIRVRILKNLKT